MQELLAQSFAYPTVVWSVLLGLASFYWLLVLVGAVGMEVLEGSVEGAADAAGAAGGGLADIGEAAEAASNAASALSVFALLRRRRAPLTVKFSMVTLLGWLSCWYASAWLGGFVPDAVPVVAWGTGLLLLTLLLAIPIAATLLIPLEPLFDTHEARRRGHLVGEVVEIETSRVDRKFGQARLEDGQAGMILQVRCDPNRQLSRGKRALILTYDEEQEFYEVEPYDDLLQK
ncbi:MAG: hypothetical protein OXR73_03610 [Myxococcales bacterium]|nr:hypothetical protein [Myxococcales bacterium]